MRGSWAEVTVLQFFADQIDQLDLCLDQLSMRERNFDRFALMLVDNVVELTLHRHARDAHSLASRIGGRQDAKHDPNLLRKALGQDFGPKVELAKQSGMVSAPVANSIRCLHETRNRAHHAGERHEATLHSLALFYFDIACGVLEAYRQVGWSRSSADRISHRALKYLGDVKRGDAASIRPVWQRLREVNAALGDTLLVDLGNDVEETVHEVDDQLSFLAESGDPPNRAREEILREIELWEILLSPEGAKFSSEHGGPTTSMTPEYFSWMHENFRVSTEDPIANWREELSCLRRQKDRHQGLRIYCSFMKNTSRLRKLIDNHAVGLDRHIQDQIDAARDEIADDRP